MRSTNVGRLSSSHDFSMGRSISRTRSSSVRAFCTGVLGFARVYYTTFARHIALAEHTREFFERRSGEGQLPMLAGACPGWVSRQGDAL